MSMHKSLKRDRYGAKRNVRKRYERLQKLIRTEKFVEGLSVFGLPKEKIIKLKIKFKEKKAEITDLTLIANQPPIEEKK